MVQLPVSLLARIVIGVAEVKAFQFSLASGGLYYYYYYTGSRSRLQLAAP